MIDAHFLKFLVVGTIGFIINTVVLVVGVRFGLNPSMSGPLGGELAIISNFLLNNFWAFSDRRITDLGQYPVKFIEFNILSMGSLLIQFVFLKAGEKIFGLKKFKEPFVDMPWILKLPLVKDLLKISIINTLARKFSAYFIFYMAGVGTGLIVNYFVYSKIIWK